LANLKPGDEILTTQAEHHANLLPWQRVAQQTGAHLKFVPINTKTFTLDYHDDLITSKTKLIAVTHSSNVLSTIWGKTNITEVIKRAHSVGARVLLDGAQSIIHESVDIQKLQPDFFVFSGHKMFAPTGIGILYIKKDLHDTIEPYQVGGSMVYSVSLESATWAQAPQKFEAGTPPISAAIGLGAAIDYINENINFTELQKHETNLCNTLIDGLKQIDNIFIVVGNNTENTKKTSC